MDITGRNEVENELAAHRANLEELVIARTSELERSREQLDTTERLASLGTLAAGISHQLNNPLGTILNSAQLALLCEDDPDAMDQWRKVLEQNIESAKRCGASSGACCNSLAARPRSDPTRICATWSSGAYS
jgi:signal transduction histidine kinase